jgi:hypothetical protein
MELRRVAIEVHASLEDAPGTSTTPSSKIVVDGVDSQA